jgi:hypothetical protein
MTDPTEDQKQLQQAYNKTFGSEEGQKVFADLEKVCFNNFTTINENPHITAYQEGMRSVFLHIKTRINMNLFKKKEVL